MLKILSRNIVIYGASNSLKSLVPILLLPVLTVHLTAIDYGILSLVEVFILFLTPIISLNIYSSIKVEYFKLENLKLKAYITNAFLLSIVAFVIVFSFISLFSKEFSTFFDVSQELLLWLPFFGLLRVSSQVLLSIYQASNKPIKFATITIIQTILDFSISYVFVVFYKLGYIGRLEGIYITYFIISVLAIYKLYKLNLFTTPNLKYTKEILNFGIPLIPHAIGGTIMAMSDRYFIAYYYDNEYVGYYTVAYQLAALMLLAGMSINQAWNPILFSMLKKKVKIQSIHKYILLITSVLFTISFLIYSLQDLLFTLLVDDKFFTAHKYFLWILIGFLFQSLYFIVTNFLFFFKKTRILALITLFGATLNLLLNYYFINFFGVIGVAYATAITWLLFFTISLIYSIRVYNENY